MWSSIIELYVYVVILFGIKLYKICDLFSVKKLYCLITGKAYILLLTLNDAVVK